MAVVLPDLSINIDSNQPKVTSAVGFVEYRNIWEYLSAKCNILAKAMKYDFYSPVLDQMVYKDKTGFTYKIQHFFTYLLLSSVAYIIAVPGTYMTIGGRNDFPTSVLELLSVFMPEDFFNWGYCVFAFTCLVFVANLTWFIGKIYNFTSCFLIGWFGLLLSLIVLSISVPAALISSLPVSTNLQSAWDSNGVQFRMDIQNTVGCCGWNVYNCTSLQPSNFTIESAQTNESQRSFVSTIIIIQTSKKSGSAPPKTCSRAIVNFKHSIIASFSIFMALFILPFLIWYVYCTKLMVRILAGNISKYLLDSHLDCLKLWISEKLKFTVASLDLALQFPFDTNKVLEIPVSCALSEPLVIVLTCGDYIIGGFSSTGFSPAKIDNTSFLFCLSNQLNITPSLKECQTRPFYTGISFGFLNGFEVKSSGDVIIRDTFEGDLLKDFQLNNSAIFEVSIYRANLLNVKASFNNCNNDTDISNALVLTSSSEFEMFEVKVDKSKFEFSSLDSFSPMPVIFSVRGTLFKVSDKHVFKKYPDSFLDVLVSGNFSEASFETSKPILIDCDPYIFQLILMYYEQDHKMDFSKYLKSGSILRQLVIAADYYGLNELCQFLSTEYESCLFCSSVFKYSEMACSHGFHESTGTILNSFGLFDRSALFSRILNKGDSILNFLLIEDLDVLFQLRDNYKGSLMYDFLRLMATEKQLLFLFKIASSKSSCGYRMVGIYFGSLTPFVNTESNALDENDCKPLLFCLDSSEKELIYQPVYHKTCVTYESISFGGFGDFLKYSRSDGINWAAFSVNDGKMVNQRDKILDICIFRVR